MEEQREESFKEFDRRVRRLDEMSDYLKVHPFTKVYTQREIFRHLQKMRTKDGRGRYKYDEQTFMKVIKTLNTRLKEMVLEGLMVYLPCGLGTLNLEERSVRLMKYSNASGRQRYKPTGCIDWDATKKLWYNDDETERDRTVVWFNTRGDKVYRIRYRRLGLGKATKNIVFYKFRPMRSFKRKIKDVEKSKVIFGYGKVYKYKAGDGRCSGFTSTEES